MVRTCILRAFGLQMPWHLSLVLRLFCFASFSSLCFRCSCGPSFNRPSICRRPDSHTYFFLFSFYLFGDVAFSEFFFAPLPFFSLYESTSYVRSFRMMFFYLVTTGWIFYTSLCKNSKTNQRCHPACGH